MPRSRPVRTIITEVVLYVGMFAVVGHLCQNLCERLLMQSELKSMKTDLSAFETVINNIGMAYEILRDEIQGILDNQLYDSTSSCFPRNQKHACLQCLKKVADVKTDAGKNTNHYLHKLKKKTSNFLQQWDTPVNDETTFTESILRCFDLDEKNSEKEFCKCMVECVSDCGKHYKLLNFQNENTHSIPSIQNTSSSHGNWRLTYYPV